MEDDQKEQGSDLVVLPDPVFVGFFPLATATGPDWLEVPIVDEICSVSRCISKAPEGWIDAWKHNQLGFFDTEDLALEVATGRGAEFDLFAYRLFPVQCENGEFRPFPVPAPVFETLDRYRFLGHDIVSRSAGSHVECSPLSCNYAARDFPVNRHCLIEDSDAAFSACRAISAGNYEPGPYFLFQVLRRESDE